ncbi:MULTISPECIES: YgaP family membrane protein [Aliiglaciecola]|uniref:YgaP family membrane protein n=1 Tax=Aliiglaciecola TaxID=1406885 RepID=UPI001C091807|nr:MULTISPECIES: DUF2892 domain-containing protein [Aliiglaciecola]MBU2879358.1 DUF2892 domain-containing protein [Aliiglaciecola lipolytica]MDO6709809.1 DUF2892 domain-containing protein [Aliiglaciecola sp. 2_MG-2023]MDO6750649.1 DUF2892 domain-containing protein [Aliiglaciecola sp. 1_MG-2023]
MKQNVGILDTAIRSILALAFLAMAVEGLYGTTISIVLGVIGAALFYTSSFGFCLLYKLLGIDTYPDFKDDSYHPE